MIAPNTRTLYVQPLNGAEEGPFDPGDAARVVKRLIYAAPDTLEAMEREAAAGAPGPWHFSYGFHSVSVQVGSSRGTLRTTATAHG